MCVSLSWDEKILHIKLFIIPWDPETGFAPTPTVLAAGQTFPIIALQDPVFSFHAPLKIDSSQYVLRVEYALCHIVFHYYLCGLFLFFWLLLHILYSISGLRNFSQANQATL